MSNATQHFQIQHLGLEVADPLGLLADAPENLLGMFRCDPSSRTGADAGGVMRLNVHQDRQHPAHREPLPLAWQGILDGIQFAVYRRAGRRRIALPSGAVTDFDIDAAWADVFLPDRGDRLARGFLLRQIVCEGLKRGGHCFLHAACLAMPWRDQCRGVVLTAPSNTGKTTAALALSNSGWRLLGDDITYLRPAHLGSNVWGFPRACHIRPGTMRLLPWLAELELSPPDQEGVRTLHPSKMKERSWLGAPWLPPALIVVVAPHNRHETRVKSIEPTEALTHLAAESLSAVPGICDADAAYEFLQFGRLAALVPACRLSAGPDLDKIAPLLEEHLETRHAQTSKNTPGVAAA
jgi:hypothetical protein